MKFEMFSLFEIDNGDILGFQDFWLWHIRENTYLNML